MQSPFLTLFLHIDDNDPYVNEVAMIVEEIIKQRIEGVKNKNGVYVTPAFPKLVYVLDENNCLRGGKYDYITKLCAICNTKRIYPDYISAKVMREIHDGEVYSPMGCVDGKEVIQYKYNDTLYTESFERMWRRLSYEFPTKLQHPDHKDMYMDVKGVSIWDNNLGEFTEVYRVIRNISDSWLNLKFSNGRSLRVTRDHPFETKNRGVVLAENLTESDQILVDKGFSLEGNEDLITPEEAWFTGVCLCDSSYSSVLNISLGDDEEDIQNKLTEIAEKDFALEMYKFHHDRGDKGRYTDLRARGNGNTSISIRRDLEDIFEGIKKVDRHIPNTIFSCSYDVRLAFLCGMIDADGHIKYNNRLSTVELGSTNKELALQEMLLAQSLGFKARVYQNHYCSSDRSKIRYMVEFDASSDLLKYLVSGKKRDRVEDTCRVNSSNFTDDYCTLTEREELDYTDFSYDVTTASEHFSVSGLYSHNCRSFLGEWQNENGDYVWEGRFNQGVVSLNLPQIGLVADGNMDVFWEELEKRLSLCFKALMCRHKALEGTVSNVSEIHWQNGAIARLGEGEKIDKLLHGGYSTISLGYIGIYEMTTAMLGVSHTTPEGLEFALKVLNRLKEATESWKKQTGIGFGLYGTPAESLCYRFCEIDKKKFGVIEDITDKGWYTNSYHRQMWHSSVM